VVKIPAPIMFATTMLVTENSPSLRSSPSPDADWLMGPTLHQNRGGQVYPRPDPRRLREGALYFRAKRTVTVKSTSRGSPSSSRTGLYRHCPTA